MYFFRHHIGDHARSSRHFSVLEDGAYLRLATAYFDKEQPLPVTAEAVYRLVMAKSKEERRAVDAVLHDHFYLAADGWRNTSIDAQIAAYHANAHLARKAANARWHPSEAGMRTHQARNPDVMHLHSDRTANHEPTTTNSITDDAITHDTHTQPPAESDQSQPSAERRGRISKSKSRPVDAYPESFKKFWNEAPRRKNTDLVETHREYQAAIERLSGEVPNPHAFLLQHVRRFALHYKDTDTVYVTCAKNWLRDSRWTDEYPSDGQSDW